MAKHKNKNTETWKKEILNTQHTITKHSNIWSPFDLIILSHSFFFHWANKIRMTAEIMGESNKSYSSERVPA